MKILVVDDDRTFIEMLRAALLTQGYEVTIASEGGGCVAAVPEEKPDLILLDMELPDIDGLTVIRSVRRWSDVPILVVSGQRGTGLGDTSEVVEALDAGADEYVPKPVALDELLARVRALCRRIPHESGAPLITMGHVTIDLSTHSVFRQFRGRQTRVQLTPTEWKVLQMLVKNVGRLVTRQDLLTEIWGSEHVNDSGNLRLYVSQLRKKIEQDPAKPQFLKTETGLGYRLELQNT
ncbi:response regulator transcription factor [Bifidobacterium sp.]|jgi:two-component system KDP operon response regulator KdpE|uniref:response regulator transcription factor n=1 Tax=Bifidobacterium sp. TaxID=41200 RepID=UPI0025BD6F27|nr:response regulator transcription factor [Bifidobacterium sp.]MCI1634928.1 response regulator transcription factor [Bifidobacterium sp.]